MWDDVEEAIEKIFLKDQIGSILSEISKEKPRHVDVLILYHIFGMNFTEISKKHNVSPNRISQIFNRGMRILKSPKYADRLKDFLPLKTEKIPCEPYRSILKPISIYDMHPAFREINLYARRLPLEKKERREKERKLKQLQKEEEERKEATEQRKLREKLQADFILNLEKSKKEAAEKYQEHLLFVSRSYTKYDEWYERNFKKTLIESYEPVKPS